MIVLLPSRQALPVKILRQKAFDYTGVLLTVFEDVEDLLIDVFGWSDLALPTALRRFTVSVLTRLKEIEASDHSLAQWVNLFGEVDSAEPSPMVGGE